MKDLLEQLTTLVGCNLLFDDPLPMDEILYDFDCLPAIFITHDRLGIEYLAYSPCIDGDVYILSPIDEPIKIKLKACEIPIRDVLVGNLMVGVWFESKVFWVPSSAIPDRHLPFPGTLLYVEKPKCSK